MKTYTISNTPEKKLTEMNEELKEEGFRIIDYGLYNDDGKEKLEDFVNNKFKEYFSQNTEDSTIAFVYENSQGQIQATQYDSEESGSVSVNSGPVTMAVTTQSMVTSDVDIQESDDSVIVTIKDQTYSFEKEKPSQIFYFVIVQEKNGERYVLQSE